MRPVAIPLLYTMLVLIISLSQHNTQNVIVYLMFTKNSFFLCFLKKFSPDLAMLICIFSLFLIAYRAAFIHAIMLKAKTASWQNYLLMYWPSESVGTITEPRVCRGLPIQFCIQAGSLFSISPRRPDEPLATKKSNSTTCNKKNPAERRKEGKKNKTCWRQDLPPYVACFAYFTPQERQ